MGSIVKILQGEPGHRTVEGLAELKFVVEYKGKGLYLVQCVFLDDPEQKSVYRELNIDEPYPTIRKVRVADE